MSKIVTLSTAAAIAALAAPAFAGTIVGSGTGAIPDNAAPAGLTITFASVTDAATSVDLDIDHTWVNDISAVLSDGSGNSVELFDLSGIASGAGASTDLAAGTAYNFSTGGVDGGIGAAAEASAGGVFNTVLGAGNFATAADLSTLVANGSDWTLLITDSAAQDTGNVNAATLNTVPEPGSLALLGLGGLALLRRRR